MAGSAGGNGSFLGSQGILPGGYFSGGETTRLNANDITINLGSFRSDDGTTDIVLGSAITKESDSVWAEGTNQGGIDTGSKAVNQVWAIYAIKNVTTGTVDVLFSLNFTSPTMPAGYTKKKLIWSFTTDGFFGEILDYLQSGDYCQFLSEPATGGLSTVKNVFDTRAMLVPPLSTITITLSLGANDAPNYQLKLRTKGSTSGGTRQAQTNDTDDITAAFSTFQILVNSDREIEYTWTNSGGVADPLSMTLTTNAFFMNTRRG